jgi:hypothetical protein
MHKIAPSLGILPFFLLCLRSRSLLKFICLIENSIVEKLFPVKKEGKNGSDSS